MSDLRWLMIGLAGSWLIGSVAMGQVGPDESLAVQRHSRSVVAPVDARLAIQRKLAIVDIHDLPARDALDRLSDAAGVNLIVHWPTLEAAGVDSVWPVTLEARMIPARQAIELILGQLADANEMILHADRWAVYLMTRQQALGDRITRAYAPARLGRRLVDLAQADQTMPAERSIDEPPSNSTGRYGPGYATRVMDLLVNSLEPDIWSVHGGQAGRVSFFDGQLIVHAPRFVHQRLGGAVTDDAIEPDDSVVRPSRSIQRHATPGFEPVPTPRRVMQRFETDADPVIRPVRYYPPNRDPESIAGIDASQLTP